MSEGTARQRTGKLSKVTCRVFREQLNFQSYADHLKAKHPEENSNNLRDYNQRTLFGPPVAPAPAPAPPPPPPPAPPPPVPAKRRKTEEVDNQDDSNQVVGEEEDSTIKEGEIIDSFEELPEVDDEYEDTSLDEEAEHIDGLVEAPLDEDVMEEEEVKETIDIEEVNQKIETILAKIECKVNTSACISEAEILTK